MLITILTGNFPGFTATGFEEDSPVVIAALALHDLLRALGIL